MSDALALRYRRFWFAAGFAQLGLILVISLLPLEELIGPPVFSDKLQHALAFSFLMVWFCGLLRPEHYWRAFVALLAYGLCMEGLQWFTGYRLMDVYDVAADIVGLALGWLLARAGLSGWALWLERRMGLAGMT